jgi:RNA polymerase sigma factor (sigma-70 family)
VDGTSRWDEVFRAEAPSLRSLAVRLLGVVPEVDDVLQDAWLRAERVEVAGLDNPAAWLRTVVSRCCFDVLRARRRRSTLDARLERDATVAALGARSPEDDALLADDISQALLVVLDRLDPDERMAFVLHDVLAIPFDEIGPIVGRSASTTKKLASRARRKVRGPSPAAPPTRRAEQRRVVEAFLAAARAGDVGGVLAVLDPDVVRRCDPQALPPGVAAVVRGADAVAQGTVALGARSRAAEVVLVDGEVGAVIAVAGRLRIALRFEVEAGRILAYDVIADPARLDRLEITLLEPS